MPVRKFLAFVTCFAALGVAPAAVAQTPAGPVSAPIYPGPDGTPHYLLGVSASGALPDLDRLAAAAAALGWPTARDLGPNGRISLVIGFRGATRAQADAFLARAAKGEFGSFTFESTLAPVAGAAKP